MNRERKKRGEREEGWGERRKQKPSINRHEALILATVYMLLHLSPVRDSSSSRASSRGHALHIREMCYVVREDIYYAGVHVWGPRRPWKPIMKYLRRVVNFRRTHMPTICKLSDRRGDVSPRFASHRDRGLSSMCSRLIWAFLSSSDAAMNDRKIWLQLVHIGAGSQQAKPLFVEIGLNYSADHASLRAFRSGMSNFLLLAHTEICLPSVSCHGVNIYFRLTAWIT